jgi:Peptidase family M3
MVANLAKPLPDREALMPHDDVVTFFHEFGHAVHGLLSNTKFARFHGTRFVSTVSSMHLVTDLFAKRCERFRGSTFSDVGELVLGTQSLTADFETFQD